MSFGCIYVGGWFRVQNLCLRVFRFDVALLGRIQ